jgi:hypothetical protein
MATKPLPVPEVYEFKLFSAKSPMSETPEVTVQVDPGYLIVGGGATTNWVAPQPGNLLTSCYPVDERHWFASSKAHSVPSPAELTAFAIAIRDTGNLEVRYFTAESPVSDQPSASVSVDKGYVLTGGGAQVKTQTPLIGQLLTASFPQDPKTWQARSKAHSVSSPGSIVVFAIGIRNRKGTDFPPIKIATATGATSQTPEAVVQIGPGYDLTGGGALVEPLDPTIGNLLFEMVPQGGGWSARSKSHSVPCEARITAYALAIRQ